MRFIHSGKILLDEKTLIDSLPKSLFTTVDIPHNQLHHELQSKITSSVEAVEAAASNILAGISSRTVRGDRSKSQTIVNAHSSQGSILPTHVTFSSNNLEDDNSARSLEESPDHVVINMPVDSATLPNSKDSRHLKNGVIKIPVQTGPIYFLCSLSDIPPKQTLSKLEKGKAVLINSNNNRRSGSARNRNIISSQSTSSAGPRNSATSPLTLPGQSHASANGEGSSSNSGIRALDNGAQENGAIEDEQVSDEAQAEAELSSMVVQRAVGFDRLREAGFSEDEIRSIRRQFHASRGTVTSTVGENGIAVDLDQDEEARARARRIEEEWIDQHGAETLPEGCKC